MSIAISMAALLCAQIYADPATAKPASLPALAVTAVFGVGIVLIVGGTLYRRRSGRRTIAAFKTELENRKAEGAEQKHNVPAAAAERHRTT
jgi:hypothetical protein